MNKKKFFLIVGILIFVNFVCATVDVGTPSHFLEQSYAPETIIRGWANISLVNEKTDSLIEDSLGNLATLKTIIDKNIYFDYECVPSDCETDYSTSNPQPTKTFTLAGKQTKTIGIKFNGNMESVDSFGMKIESNAGASCKNQIKIDFFEDDEIEVGNEKTTDQVCSQLKYYGCFDNTNTLNEYAIANLPNKHCQRIRLSESPSFEIGAWVKKSGSETKPIHVGLFDEYLEEIENASCVLPDANSVGSEISCTINYLIKNPVNYYVCIFGEDDEPGVYKIRGYTISDGCGFYGSGIGDEIASYQIFAEGKKFAPPGTIFVNNTLAEEDSLGGRIQDYIFNKYGSLNCEENECIVPMRIYSETPQTLTLKDLKVLYSTNLGPGVEINQFYDVNKTSAKMNSEFSLLDLETIGFYTPSQYGNLTYKLNIGEKEIFSDKLFVQNVPIIVGITPTTTFSGYPTIFQVFVNISNSNVSEVKWEFGDNSVETTDKTKTTHTYNSTGIYEMKVTVTDGKGRSSYTDFEMAVGNPKEIIDKLLKEKLASLTVVKNKISGMETFYKNTIDSVLEIEKTENELKQLQRDFLTANTDAEYTSIMTKILEFDVPKTIVESEDVNELLFFPMMEEINIDALVSAGGGSYEQGDEEKYKNGVIGWQQENADVKISMKEFSASYDGFQKTALKIFSINVKEKTKWDSTPFLIIKDIADLSFKENYKQNKDDLGYYSIALETSDQTITFSTTEDIEFFEVPAFISPKIDRLSIAKGNFIERKLGSSAWKWILFLIVLILIVAIMAVIYFIIQIWYKKNYENYLFKNKGDLQNILSFISVSTSKGMKKEEILQKLKKAGWKKEQIDYAMNKSEGKKTGLAYEIPLDEKKIEETEGFFNRLKEKFFKKKTNTIAGNKKISYHF